MKLSIGQRVALVIVPRLGEWFIRLWFATCRIRVHDPHVMEQLDASGRPIVAASWHYCVLGIFAIFKNVPAVFMISASKDGEYLARLAERLGFSVVRGSSNRKGASAAKELIRELRAGKNCGLIADGSQGPARIAQSGPLLLAARSEGTVLPLLYSSSSYFSFKTWDRMILPKPFSVIDLFYGSPISVPKDIKTGNLEEYRKKLEEDLNDLYDRAWQQQGREMH